MKVYVAISKSEGGIQTLVFSNKQSLIEFLNEWIRHNSGVIFEEDLNEFKNFINGEIDLDSDGYYNLGIMTNDDEELIITSNIVQ